MKKILVVFGTRPEAIKMCPVVKALQAEKRFKTCVCVTGQHREMLDQVLEAFSVVPDYDLEIMKESQNLFDITTSILDSIRSVLMKEKPEICLVHGDTSTTFVTALACFYLDIPVGHVEAGLRTYNLKSPFPEEFNRQGTGIIADFHFAPTNKARENLILENKDPSKIFVTGNTVIDALKTTVYDDFQHPIIDWVGNSKLLLITAHRRENLGAPMRSMFRAIRRIVEENPDVRAVYPIHLNPIVRKTAKEYLSGCDKIKLIEPLDVLEFHNIMNHSYLIITDSGGIQEEAPSLGKPVLVMRDTTERPEGIEAGTLKLVGTDEDIIYKETNLLLNNKVAYQKMARAKNPYGDGKASNRIVSILLDFFGD